MYGNGTVVMLEVPLLQALGSVVSQQPNSTGRFLKSHLTVRLRVLRPGTMNHRLEGKGTDSVKAKSGVFVGLFSCQPL